MISSPGWQTSVYFLANLCWVCGVGETWWDMVGPNNETVVITSYLRCCWLRPHHSWYNFSGIYWLTEPHRNYFQKPTGTEKYEKAAISTGRPERILSTHTNTVWSVKTVNHCGTQPATASSSEGEEIIKLVKWSWLRMREVSIVKVSSGMTGGATGWDDW